MSAPALPSVTDFNVGKIMANKRAAAVAYAEQDVSNLSLYDYIQDFLQDESNRRTLYIGGGCGSVALAAYYIYNKIYNSGPSRSPRFKGGKDSDGEERIVVHCNTRGFFTPSIATASLQLETFLRVAEIQYEKDYGSDYAQDEEEPLMEYGDEIANDFRESLQLLQKDYDINLDKNVSASRRTASHLVEVLLENEFSWGILIWRWIYDQGQSMAKIQKAFTMDERMIQDIALKVKAATKHHPIGQLGREEFVSTLNQGIHDISAALGKHEYFQGQRPGVVDCHAFAILVQLMYNLPGSPFEKEIRRYPNLVNFVNRMKQMYWSDWYQRILRNNKSRRNSNSPGFSGMRKTSRMNSMRFRNSRSPTVANFRPRRFPPLSPSSLRDEGIETNAIGDSGKTKPNGILKGYSQVNPSTHTFRGRSGNVDNSGGQHSYQSVSPNFNQGPGTSRPANRSPSRASDRSPSLASNRSNRTNRSPSPRRLSNLSTISSRDSRK